MHVPAPHAPPQSCALIWTDQHLERADCPDEPGLQAYAETRLAQLDLAGHVNARRASEVVFIPDQGAGTWRARSVTLIFPEPRAPLIALSNAFPANCLVGGSVNASGALEGWDVACHSAGGEGGATQDAYLAEAQRFAGTVRILSAGPERCHTLPLRFVVEGAPPLQSAPTSASVCPSLTD